MIMSGVFIGERGPVKGLPGVAATSGTLKDDDQIRLRHWKILRVGSRSMPVPCEDVKQM